MLKAIKIIFVLFTGFLLYGCSQSSEKKKETYHATADRNVLIQSVIIVDTRTGQLSDTSDVLISKGKILSISPAREILNDITIDVIDGHGKFLVPGYLNMHAHPLGTRDISGSLDLFLANGITGYRQMSGNSELLEQRKSGELSMGTEAPELLAMPGEVLNPLNAGTSEDAIAEIDKQKKEGADFIKVVAVNSEVFFAAQAEAKRIGLPLVGHIPEGVDVIEASKRGMKSIEHLGPGNSFLIACSHDEVELTKVVDALPPLKGPPFKIPFIKLLTAGKQERMTINPLLPPSPENIAILQKAIDSYTQSRNQELAKQFIAYGTWQVPTLIRLRMMQFADANEYRNNLNLKYVPKTTLENWRKLSKDFTENMPESSKIIYKKLYDLQTKLVKIFDGMGVKMLAGDDFGGGWVVAGFGLHQEFDELEKAGLRPLTVLQMTTLNGAEFLGRTSEMGQLKPVKMLI